MASEEQRAKWRANSARYRDAHREKERERSRKQAAEPGYRERKRREEAARTARDPERERLRKKAANAKLSARGYHRERYAKDPQRARDIANKWTAANRDKTREAKLRDRFRITPEEYARMFKRQNGVCAICKKPERIANGRLGKARRLAIDHCHDTKVIRGLLCYRCNVGIGLFNHDLETLGSAIAYLGGVPSGVG